jgi:hypothetical protein
MKLCDTSPNAAGLILRRRTFYEGDLPMRKILGFILIAAACGPAIAQTPSLDACYTRYTAVSDKAKIAIEDARPNDRAKLIVLKAAIDNVRGWLNTMPAVIPSDVCGSSLQAAEDLAGSWRIRMSYDEAAAARHSAALREALKSAK